MENVLDRKLAALEKVSDKIRLLDRAGMSRADIARKLGKRYQHVRNVLERDREKSAKPDRSFPGSIDAGEGVQSVRVRVSKEGMLYLPAPILDQLQLGEEGMLTLRVEDGELHAISPQVAIARLRAIARSLNLDGASVVDELIAERRREAANE